MDDDTLVYGKVPDWEDGEGPRDRTGPELMLKLVSNLNPPNSHAIQLNAVQGWKTFRRNDNERIRALLSRLNLAIFEAAKRGRYPIPILHRAEQLVELLQL